jgi:hypothetical protein
MRLGINLAAPTYYSGARAFTNLLAGGSWRINKPGTAERPALLNEFGTPKTLAKGESALTGLSRPSPVFEGRTVPLAVTWEGKGTFSALGDVADIKAVGPNRMTMTALPGKNGVHLQIKSLDPADPPRNIVVGEPTKIGSEAVPLFDPAFIASLRGYSILRFIKWQNAEANVAMTLDNRTRPEEPLRSRSSGYAQEHMIALCNQLGVDGWFCAPWNADDAFHRDMATRCRDTLKRNVCVETSNEVWNPQYSVHQQALAEGKAQWPTTDYTSAYMRRYAQRSAEIFAIWTEVFSQTGQMHRLIRVAAGQNGGVWGMERALRFENFADKIDALACAPYIDLKFAAGQVTKVGNGSLSAGLDIIFDRSIPAAIDKGLAGATAMAALADKYGKRFTTYEAGQHIVSPKDIPQLEAIQRDPRMENVYRTYIGNARSMFPGSDLILLADVGPPDKHGAWGHREWTTQPLAEAPKARGVAAFLPTSFAASGGPASL